LNGYCRWERGFQEGREGDTYHGVCTRAQEEEFLPAYRDGQMVHAAEQALTNARSSVESLGDRLEELDDKITAKQAEARAEGLTDEQRDAIRDRIQEIRRERADTERDWRRAQNAVDDAERDIRDVRRRFQGQYGGW
jgi:chromosome segregation ATPase